MESGGSRVQLGPLNVQSQSEFPVVKYMYPNSSAARPKPDCQTDERKTLVTSAAVASLSVSSFDGSAASVAACQPRTQPRACAGSVASRFSSSQKLPNPA